MKLAVLALLINVKLVKAYSAHQHAIYVFAPVRLVLHGMRKIQYGPLLLVILTIGIQLRKHAVLNHSIFLFISFQQRKKLLSHKLNVKILEAYAIYTEDCSSTLCKPSKNMVCQASATGCACPNSLSGYRCDCLSTHYYDFTNGCG